MCERYTRYLPWSAIHRLYRLTAPADIGRNDAPRYNIAPTDEVPFITAAEDRNHNVPLGPLVAGSVLGEGDAQGDNIQRQNRDSRYDAGIPRCIQIETLPHPGRRLLQMDDVTSDLCIGLVDRQKGKPFDLVEQINRD